MPTEELWERFSLRFSKHVMTALRVTSSKLELSPTATIRQAVNKYLMLFGPWPGFVVAENESYNVLVANQAALDHLGYTRSQVVGRSMMALYTPLTRNRLEILNELTSTNLVRAVKVDTLNSAGESASMLLWAHRDLELTNEPTVWATWVPPDEAALWWPELLG